MVGSVVGRDAMRAAQLDTSVGMICRAVMDWRALAGASGARSRIRRRPEGTELLAEAAALREA
jgi:hypothetical protein